MPRTRKLPKGIDLTASGKYRSRVYNQGSRYVVGTFDTLSDANAALAIARSEVARKVFVPPAEERAARKEQKAADTRSAVTVDELADRWFTWMKRIGRSEGTVYTHESRYRTRIRPDLGSMPARSVAPDDIDEWWDALVEDVTPALARNVYLSCSALFNFGAGKLPGQGRRDDHLLDFSPVMVPGATKYTPTRPPSDDVVATPEQVTFIAEHMPPEMRLSVLLGGWTALRIGEVLGLHRGDVTTGKDGRMWIAVRRQLLSRPGLHEADVKSEAGVRDVPVPTPLIDDVRAHMKLIVGRGRDALMFPRRGAGNWIHPNVIRVNFNAGVKLWNDEHPDQQLDNFRFHSLRHTALSRIGEAGATLEELKRYAGHASADMVSRYQHASRSRLASLSDEIGVLIP